MDYIFYRTYLAYEKKEMPGKFSSSLYLACICIFLFLPIYGILNDLFLGASKLILRSVLCFYLGVVFFYIFRRFYRNEKLKYILSCFKNSPQNEKIPTWLFFFILPICMIAGIGLYSLLSSYFIQNYNLEGYLYNLLFNHS